jgi:hypothetical protein
MTGFLHVARILLAGVLLCAFAGCADLQHGEARSYPLKLNVSLPAIELGQFEYIESVEVDLRGARIVSINRLLDD